MAASCPLNITFYACDFGERFLGCCVNGSPADTCTHGCPQEDLLPASFEKEGYGYITRAACTSGDWWSCANTVPPFLGCCLSNPCLDRCPPGDLRAAIFSQNQTDSPLYSAIHDTPAAASSTSIAAASPTPALTTGAAHSAAASPLPIRKNSTGEIVGGVIGGIAAVAGILLGVILLYRRLKSQGHKGSDLPGTNEKGSIEGTIPRSPTVSDISHRGNQASHEVSAKIANSREGVKLPTGPPRSMNGGKPQKVGSAISGISQGDHKDDKTPQELPPNHAPIPEIASSDPPQPCYELPSSEPAVQEHAHLKALQPGGPGSRPFSASSLSRTPPPYGLAFRPHSPSRLSEVSSLDSTLPMARELSTVSVTDDGIGADV